MTTGGTALVYVRPWSQAQFDDLARRVWPSGKLIHVSEHAQVDNSTLPHLFYSAVRSGTVDSLPANLASEDIDSVACRCRLLRALPRKKAVQLIAAMAHSIEVLFAEHQPVAVLSLTVDNYVLDLLSRASRRHSVPFIGLVPSFVDGYFRVTVAGERQPLRDVSPLEVEAVRDVLLRATYKPKFVAQTPAAVRLRTLKNWAQNLPKPLWFRARRILGNDPFNCHYLTAQIVSQRYWTLWPQWYEGRRPTCRDEIDCGKPLVFLPLQMSPEATIDYWSLDTSWIDYEARVLSLIDSFSDTHTFLVKEHPNVVGYRTPGFYRELARRRNCVLIAPEVSSNAMLEMSDGVVVCTGTVGFEAALRGVPVYSDGGPWHLPGDVVRPTSNLSELVAGVPHVGSAPEPLVQYLLEALLPGHFINDGSWRHEIPEHVASNERVAESILLYGYAL